MAEAVRQDHDTAEPLGPPLTAGPRWYRARIRLIGPLLGLVPMAVLGAISMIALEMFEGRTSGLIGLVSGVSAAPVLLAVGAPLADDSQYPLAILASVPIWLLLGFLASRRATRFLAASWRDYWRELFFLTAAVILGAVVALIAAAMLLDESLVL